MATERYFIGPGLKDKLGDVIRRVDGTQNPGGSVTPIQTRFDEPVRPPLPGGFKACTFTGGWGFNSSQTVRSISSGETFNATNIIYDIPNTGLTLNCVIGKDGTQWYLANVQHQSTNVLTRVAIEGASFVFSAASVQVIGVTSQRTAFPLDVCDEYTNSTATTSTSSGQAASFSATSYFFG
jgi:hypothetical protein